MSELYRLTFRGEVLPGQHPAVVRKRLAQEAAFDDAVLDKLVEAGADFAGLKASRWPVPSHPPPIACTWPVPAAI